MSAFVRTDDAAVLRKQLEEVLDECVFVEKQREDVARQLESERNRSSNALAALEDLVGYVALLESQVVLPALGPLVTVLAQFKEAADRRARGESLAVSVVTAETNPRLSRALAAMRAPSAEVQQEAERSKAFLSRSGGVPPAMAAEDGYVLLAALLREKSSLQGLLRGAATKLGGDGIAAAAQASPPRRGAAVDTSVTSPPLGSLRAALGGGASVARESSLGRTGAGNFDAATAIERLSAENRALQQELALLQASCDARIVAADRDRELVQVKLDDAQRQLRDAERDRDAAKNRAQGAESVDQLYQQSILERRMLEDRLLQLEEEARQHNNDKVLVAQKFAVLQRALEQNQNNSHNQTIYGHTPNHGGGATHFHGMTTAPPAAAPPSMQPTASRQDDAVYRQLQAEAGHLRAELDQMRASMREREVKYEKELLALRKKSLLGGSMSAATPAALRGTALSDDASVIVGADGSITLKAPPGASHPSIDNANDYHTTVAAQAKLRALELTVQALNSELAALEEKIMSMEQQFAEEKGHLLAQMDAERQRAERQQHDADSVVSELSRELTATISENSQLKQRVKHLLSDVANGRRGGVPSADTTM